MTNKLIKMREMSQELGALGERSACTNIIKETAEPVRTKWLSLEYITGYLDALEIIADKIRKIND